MDPPLGPSLSSGFDIQAVTELGEARQLVFSDLSDCFNPFLPRFVREALLGGGEVWVSREDSAANGLLLYNVIEKVGSIFTHDARVARRLFEVRAAGAFFSEFSLSTKAEMYPVFAVEPAERADPHPFTHPVRMARRSEHPAIIRMLNEMYGPIDTRWLQAASRDEERCFVVDVAGEIAGVGWVSIVGAYGRLHSLSVRPHYRRIGIGTDLWHARILWAQGAGARRIISEISEHNVASLAIARAGGMRRIGQQFLSHKSGGGATPVLPLGSPAERADLVGHVD